MHSARTLYRFNLALGGLAALVVLAGPALALGRIELTPRPLAHWLSDCGRYFLPHITAVGLVIAGLAFLGIVVLARGLRSASRQIRGCRAFLRELEVIGEQQLDRTPALVIAGSDAHAFCGGFLSPRVYVSAAAVDQLSEAQLAAVLAHENHHARRRDPLRILLVTMLADALFFLPSLRRMRTRYAVLAELAADEAAVAAGDASHLASALLHFGEAGPEGMVGIEPERVDHLLGKASAWRIPASTILAALLTVAGLVALVTAAASTAGRTSLGQLASQSCMIAMTAAPIVALAGLAVIAQRTITRLR